ncbi:MAG: 1-(5-phosphoribosyl)-5-[(5-phosphoribosylamino)methylideneamino] imidazole-4-carboxamide isomerase [Gammaproteobacteria bacterium]|jgi:phosphoribosylformimino-5-aminoimidazole carboxamide ribotide isomerase|nr:1-(5-phosphoribosyl)-5-[(5-phosphoribosylamino)methylideneamino] imidazole-4-carboxamide isomerase [Gammaproteobacteria bacterium]
MRLIPSIDLRGGQCVRLLHGDFTRETIYPVDPLELAARYRQLGARWLHVVDLDGARDGALANRQAIVEMAKIPKLSLQVGGGVRSAAAVDELLSAGIARVVVGSAAIEKSVEVGTWMRFFGKTRICLALDVRVEMGEPLVQTRGWTKATTMTLWQSIEPFLRSGLQHVLCTDIGRDGALSGPNVELYQQCLTRFPKIKWQASGGIRDITDLELLSAMGMSAAISGRALLEGHLADIELRKWMRR